MLNEFLKELDVRIRARYPLIYIVTWEERRARDLLLNLCERQKKTFFEWTITDGLRCVSATQKGQPSAERTRKPLALLNDILQADTAAIFVLKDFHYYLDAPEIVRQIRDLANALRRTKKTVIFLSPVFKLPEELEKDVTILDLPLPSVEELKELVNDRLSESADTRRYRVDLSDEDFHNLAEAAHGLTLLEAENAFARAIVEDSVLDQRDVQAILQEKRQVIRKSGLLEYYEASENLDRVGGMDLLKNWLAKRTRAFSEEARNYGLPEPRGLLLVGVQGCGKSLVAKATASVWRLPLLRLDMSRIFQGFIGSSEQNMRRALAMAESLAPVVLWIDEIEKAFSGMEGSGASDSGTTARVVGTFLTWIQEKKAPVFIVATANEVRHLPPELLRKGRLDEIFFVDLPRSRERAEIFQIHLTRVKRDPAKFDLKTLVAGAKGFSGAEIEQAIYSAMHDSFYEQRDLATADIQQALRETIPLSVTMREKIDELRKWARQRARPVTRGSARSNVTETDDGPV